jgi:hypothetical protein
MNQFIEINDQVEMHDRFYYIKQMEQGREQDSGDTERERV